MDVTSKSEVEKECIDAWNAAMFIYLIDHPFIRAMALLLGLSGVAVAAADLPKCPGRSTKRRA